MGIIERKLISEGILFGKIQEHPDVIIKEVRAGIRPLNWNKAGHPEHDMWVLMIEMKQEAEEKERISQYK